MNRIFKLMIIALAALSFASCNKTEVIYQNTMHSYKYDVGDESWAYSISLEEEKDPALKYKGNWYVAELTVPELTRDILNNGMIKMYRIFDDGIQTEIPYSRQFENFDEETYISDFYTELIIPEYEVGRIYIYYTRSDFMYEDNTDFIPDPMTFRLVITEPL